MLSENDIELLNESSKGKVLLLIAPEGKDFEIGIQRIIIENSELSILTNDGDLMDNIITMEDVAANLKSGLWEIREAYDTPEVKSEVN